MLARLCLTIALSTLTAATTFGQPPADAAFLSGREVVVSAAVFDGREGMEHSTSTELTLRLEPPR